MSLKRTPVCKHRHRLPSTDYWACQYPAGEMLFTARCLQDQPRKGSMWHPQIQKAAASGAKSVTSTPMPMHVRRQERQRRRVMPRTGAGSALLQATEPPLRRPHCQPRHRPGPACAATWKLVASLHKTRCLVSLNDKTVPKSSSSCLAGNSSFPSGPANRSVVSAP